MEKNIPNEISIQQQRVLYSYSRALKREELILSGYPELIWQQLSNRLQWEGDEVKFFIKAEYDRRKKSNNKAWFHSLSHPQENEAFQFNLPYQPAQFNSTGKLISTFSNYGTVRICNAISGEELIKLDIEPYEVESAIFSKDSKRILLRTKGFSEDETRKNFYSKAMIWDINNSQTPLVLDSQDRWVKQAIFSPDCKLIATIEDKYTKEEIHSLKDENRKELLSFSEVKIWNAETGEPIHVIKGNIGQVTSISFNINSSIIATCCEGSVEEGEEPTGNWIMTGVNQQSREYRKYRIVKDSAVHLWNTYTGKEISVLSDHEGQVYDVVFSPDGSKLLTTGSEPSAILWDAKTFQKIKVLDEFHGLPLFSPDGKKIITNEFNQVSLWNLELGEIIHTFQGHEEWATESAHTASGRSIEILDVCFNPSGDKIVTCGNDNTARIWDITTGKELIKLSGHDKPVLTADFSPDGNRIVTSCSGGTGKVWLINDEVHDDETTGHVGRISSVVFSPDGQVLASTGEDRTICISDPNTGELISKFGYDREAVNFYDRLIFSPDGKRLATLQIGKFFPKVWNVQDGTLNFKSEHKYGVLALDYSPKGTCFVTGSNDFNAYIRDINYGWERTKLKGHKGWVNSVVFDPSGEFILTGSTDHSIRIWKTSNGKLVKILDDHVDSVNIIVFNNEGTRFASASDDKTIIIWDFQTKSPLFKMTNDISYTKEISFSKDDKLIAVAEGGGNVLISEIPNNGKRNSIFSKNKPEEIKITQKIDGISVREVFGVGQSDSDEMSIPNLFSSNPKPNHHYAISYSGFIKVWQIETNKEIAAFPLSSMTDFDSSPSKPLLALGDEGGRLHFLELVGDA